MNDSYSRQTTYDLASPAYAYISYLRCPLLNGFYFQYIFNKKTKALVKP